MTDQPEPKDEWSEWWDARMAAIEEVLGKADDTVGHGIIPFCFGAEMGGAADVVYFSNHLDGVACVTSELIGCDSQVENELGNYELMICHRKDDEQGKEWGSNIISRLAHYTCEAELKPGDTMDIGAVAPEESTITAFLFFGYATFTVKERKAGLLLCVGITDPELNICREGKRETVEEKLKGAGIYPFTDLYRDSVT